MLKTVNIVAARVLLVSIICWGTVAQTRAQKASLSSAEKSVLIKANASIEAAELEQHLRILAHDSLEGRESGCAGHEKALNYLRRQYEKMGIAALPGTDNYTQRFTLPVVKWKGFECHIRNVKDRRYLHGRDFILLPTMRPPGLSSLQTTTDKEPPLPKTLTLRWAGTGAADTLGLGLPKYDQAILDDPRQAWVMLDTIASDIVPRSFWQQHTTRKRILGLRRLVKGPILVATYRFDYWYKRVGDYWQEGPHGLSKSSRAGAPIFVLGPRMSRMLLKDATMSNWYQYWFLFGGMVKEGTALDGLTYLKVDEMAKAWAEQQMAWKAGKSTPSAWPWLGKGDSLKFNIEAMPTTYSTANLLAHIPGTSAKEEAVVISAHSDHIGRDAWDIYNGADDDGTGTAAVLTLARQFQDMVKKGIKPKRTLIFCHFTAEEKGLLGSNYYSEHPLWPMDKTYANLNIDMIGRHDSRHEANPANYVYGIGAAKITPNMVSALEAANTLTQLELDNYYDRPDDKEHLYERSDHYNFAKNGVPVVFFFSGLHDDYHGPGDEVERIEWPGYTLRTRLVLDLAYHLAQKKGPLK